MHWFKRKMSLECCYCGRMMRVPVDATQCECGKESIPLNYKEFREQAPPFYVPLVGWSSVGKTVWLLSVTRRLRELGSTIWNGYTALPANAVTMEYQQQAEEHIRTSSLPNATPLGVQDAYVMVLLNMPYWGGRTFVMRDCGGENFETFQVYEEQIPFLQKSRTSFFMLSLNDIWQSDKKSMDDLLNCYINTLAKHCKLRQERRKIVVVLSKADELKGKLPGNVYNYLINDPVAILADTPNRDEFDERRVSDYMEQLQRVSDEIEDWLSTMRDGKQLINIAGAFNMDLRFSVVSSLGCPPENGKLTQGWRPWRVLDPLLWALEFHSA